MREISTRIVFAGITITLGINRGKVTHKTCVQEIDLAVVCVQGAVSPCTSWCYAVKEVATVLDCTKEVNRFADTEEVAGFVLRENGINPADRRVHIVFIKRSANAIAVKVHR